MDAVDRQLADVSAVLVEDRILRRVIKKHLRLGGLGLQVPHADVYTIARAELGRLVEQDELPVPLESLPERVIALRGSRAQLAAGDAEATSAVWRAIFHARIHQRFDELFATGRLTTTAVRERVNRIGQTEFDEIRFALRQADRLLPPATDESTYVEFVALYLELRYFAPRDVERTFPTLEDTAHVDATIALDVDAAELLAAARPAAAPALPPTARVASIAGRRRKSTGAHVVAAVAAATAATTSRPHSARADAARARGNLARAAMLSLRADDRDGARADLEALAQRLAKALGGVSPLGWADALLPVAESVASEPVLRYTIGARLLADLQAACVVAERQARAIDVLGWAVTLGRRPIVRDQPATHDVRIAKHLHAAGKKLADLELASGNERERLADAVHAMIEHAEARVRAVMRPALETALAGVQLAPRDLPERVAQKKLVDELLDQAVTVGHLSLGNLRDAISHNDLKMENLRASQLVFGDQLLRCDRALAQSLDGVYRRGEIYLRFLQKISSILFGTRVGRLLALYLLLPIVGAYVPVTGAQHIVGPLTKLVTGEEPEIATPAVYIGTGIFVFLMIHAPPARRVVRALLRGVAFGLHTVVVRAPRAVWRLPITRRVVASRFARYIVDPALAALVLTAWLDAPIRWPVAGGVFFVLAILGNSRVGKLMEEIGADWVVRGSRHLARYLLPGLVKYVLELFAELMELLERGIYHVDEALRFGAGESRLSLVIKATLGTLWFFVAYFLRLYVNLFVEPTVNPIKHFPVVTVAAKLTLPFSPSIVRTLRHPLRKVVGRALAGGAAAFTVLVIPGFAGFLVWELKENWKLYDGTRPKELRAISIGHHGETMVGFMKPGFHSGTVPKLYAKLRRAAWKGDERGVAKYREGLHHVEEAIKRFADRALVSMLDEAQPFGATDVAVTGVEIASNRVQIVIGCASVSPELAHITLEEQSGWLIATIRKPGWIAQLSAERRAILELALAGFYKLCGVELVREQLEAAIGTAPYDIATEGLVVWPGAGYATEVIYDLHAREPVATVRGASLDGEPITLGGKHALFGREPIAWSAWTGAWQALVRGEPHASITPGPSLVRT